MAKQLLLTIGLLDTIIFNEARWEDLLKNPSKVASAKIEKRVGLLKEDEQDETARFSPKEKSGKEDDRYMINPHFENLLSKKGHWFLFKKEDQSPYQLGEIIIAIAAHEVRHRIQYRLQVELFSPETVTGNQLLDSIIKSAEKDMSRGWRIINAEDKEKEFDALVIEKITGEIVGAVNSDLGSIAEIIKSTTIDEIKEKIELLQ